MKNYCMNFVSIKNLETKAINNIQAVKGGEADGGGTRSKVLNVQGGTDTTVTVWP